MFSLSFVSQALGTTEVSFFDSVRAARRHAKWLQAQSWASDVVLWDGQAGGMRLPL